MDHREESELWNWITLKGSRCGSQEADPHQPPPHRHETWGLLLNFGEVRMQAGIERIVSGELRVPRCGSVAL